MFYVLSVRCVIYDDIFDVFGSFEKDLNWYFFVGNIFDMDESFIVCIDMERFIEWSSGIYGRIGIGKLFIVRLLMVGIIFCDKVLFFIFDVYLDYGFDSVDEENWFVKGFKSFFGIKV